MSSLDREVSGDRIRVGLARSEFERRDVNADDIYEALSSRRRRFIIDLIGSKDIGDETTIDEITNGVAYIEEDDVEDPDRVATDIRKRYYISVYQTHLPVLKKLGLIRYDKRSGVVETTGATKFVRGIMMSVTRGLAEAGVLR